MEAVLKAAFTPIHAPLQDNTYAKTKHSTIYFGVRTKRRIYANIFYVYFIEMYLSSTKY